MDNHCAEEDSTFSASVPPCDLKQRLDDLLKSEKGDADVVFEVAGEKIAAHRCVLAARSSAFYAKLFESMKEGSNDGAVVRVQDMDADVFRELLFFAYTGSLPSSTQDVEEGEDYLKLQHLLVAADRYDMERLKLVCAEKLCNDIDVGTVTTVLALSEQHHCGSLKRACLDFVRANMGAVMRTDGFQHLLTSCPSVVDDLVAVYMACIS